VSSLSSSTRTYRLPPDKESCWAIVIIDPAIGFFSAVSDHGNYGYLWTHPGGEFRKFLVNCDLDYVYGKLTHEQRVFDLEASVKAAKDAILSRRRDGSIGAAQAREEYDGLQISSEHEFVSWQQYSSLDDSHEFYMQRKESECWGFCQKLFTRFQQVLREELKKEAEDGGTKEEAGDPPK
jgi:hypothetical protein